MLKKNDIVELEISDSGIKGEGIGHIDGLAVFVPAAAPGDVLSAKIVKLEKKLAYARIEAIIKPSPLRVEPDCHVFPRCGGCSFRHISYEAECSLKLKRVSDAMKRIAKIDIEPEEFIPADEPDNYRCKAQLPCVESGDSVGFGFFAERSHRVVLCDSCKLQPQGFDKIAAAIGEYARISGCKAYSEEAHTGLLRHLYIRRSHARGELMVCLVVNSDKLPDEPLLVKTILDTGENVAGILINVNTLKTNVILGTKCRLLYGRDYITETLLGVDFKISPLSFFQVNPAQAEKLYLRAALYAQLEKGDTLLDLYCGAGSIGLTMAGQVKKLIGVEISFDAVEDAKLNAELNGIENAEFICADAAEAALQLKERGLAPDVIVIDPPRKGCDVNLLSTIAQMQPKRVVYVSCDPATLARDIANMQSFGYEAERLTAVDMFPRTGHVETVVLISRVKE